MLALISVVAYHLEGVRAKGLFGYLKSWLPPGLEDMNLFGPAAIFDRGDLPLRPADLALRSTLRHILAGHLLILFMAGGLAVLLGLAALGGSPSRSRSPSSSSRSGWWHAAGVHLLDLDSIYIGGATAETH